MKERFVSSIVFFGFSLTIELYDSIKCLPVLTPSN